MTYKCGGVNTK